MKTINKKKLFASLGMASVITLLSACASEPSPWTKQQSIWDQRRQETAEAPSADQYKEELGAVDQGTATEVDLSYQTEQVESFAPEMAVEEAEPVEAAAMMAPETTGMTAPEQEIMNQPADYYTVQLIASVDVDRVYKFAEQNQLSIRYVVPTMRDGVIWYVLLLDVYPDYSSARTAMEEVAATLPTQPWIRKVGSVQKLIQ